MEWVSLDGDNASYFGVCLRTVFYVYTQALPAFRLPNLSHPPAYLLGIGIKGRATDHPYCCETKCAIHASRRQNPFHQETCNPVDRQKFARETKVTTKGSDTGLDDDCQAVFLRHAPCPPLLDDAVKSNYDILSCFEISAPWRFHEKYLATALSRIDMEEFLLCGPRNAPAHREDLGDSVQHFYATHNGLSRLARLKDSGTERDALVLPVGCITACGIGILAVHALPLIYFRQHTSGSSPWLWQQRPAYLLSKP